jgi:hypothetical protein
MEFRGVVSRGNQREEEKQKARGIGSWRRGTVKLGGRG